jgi:hypothetical protein
MLTSLEPKPLCPSVVVGWFNNTEVQVKRDQSLTLYGEMGKMKAGFILTISVM